MKRVLVPIAMALCLFGLWVPSAFAGTTTKPYAVDIAPHPIAAGSTQTFIATLSNETKTQQIGSANLTVPTGFSIVSVGEPVAPRDGHGRGKHDPTPRPQRSGRHVGHGLGRRDQPVHAGGLPMGR